MNKSQIKFSLNCFILIVAYYLSVSHLFASGVVNVQFDSKPAGANLYLDDILQGNTPLDLNLKPGKYKLKLFHPESMPFEQAIFISPEKEEKKIYFDLTGKRGFLTVIGTPEGLPIYIDGKLAGKLPLKKFELYAGFHQLEMLDEKYFEFRKEIEILPEQIVEVYIEGVMKAGSKIMPELDNELNLESEKPLKSQQIQETSASTGGESAASLFALNRKSNFLNYANFRLATNSDFKTLLELSLFQFSVLIPGFPLHLYSNLVTFGISPDKMQNSYFGAFDLGLQPTFDKFGFLLSIRPLNIISYENTELKSAYNFSPCYVVALNFKSSPNQFFLKQDNPNSTLFFQLFYLNFINNSQGFGKNYFGFSIGSGYLLPAAF